MDRAIQIKAISNPSRIRVLKLLADPDTHFGHQWSADAVEFGVCMTLIAQELGVAQPTASRHLDILKQAGFLSVRRHMKWSYCKRNDAAIAEFFDWFGTELCVSANTELT